MKMELRAQSHLESTSWAMQSGWAQEPGFSKKETFPGISPQGTVVQRGKGCHKPWICAWEMHTSSSPERSGITDFPAFGSESLQPQHRLSDLSIPTADLNIQGWDVLMKYGLNRERRPLSKTKCGVNITRHKSEYQDVPQTPMFLVIMDLIPIPTCCLPISHTKLGLSSLIWFNLIKKMSPGMCLEEPVTAPGVWWLHQEFSLSSREKTRK